MGKGRRNKRRNSRYEPDSTPSYDYIPPEPEWQEESHDAQTCSGEEFDTTERALGLLIYGTMGIDEAIILHGTYRHLLAVWTNTAGPRALWYKFVCTTSIILLLWRLWALYRPYSRSKLRGLRLFWAQDDFHHVLVVLFFQFQKTRPITASLFPLALIAAEELSASLAAILLPMFFRARHVLRRVESGIHVTHVEHPVVEFFRDLTGLLTTLGKLSPYLHLLVLVRAMMGAYQRKYSVYGFLVYLHFVLHLYYSGAYGKSSLS